MQSARRSRAPPRGRDQQTISVEEHDALTSMFLLKEVRQRATEGYEL